MAYVRLTGFSHNGYTKLHYDFFGSYSGKNKAKPHTTKYGYNKRNLAQFGINCRTGNFNQTVKDFEKFKPKHRKNSTINLVMGFKNNDEIDCHRASDRIMAIRYCIKFIHKAFGPNVQALISLQHDSREPHVHITLNNCDIRTLHAISSSKRNIYRLHAINKAMIKDHNKRYPNHKFIIATSPNYHSESNSLNNSIKKKFLKALHIPSNNSKRAIRQYMKDKYKITVRFIRPNRRKSKRHHKTHRHYGITLIPKGRPRIKASTIGIKYKSVIHQIYKINRPAYRSINQNIRRAKSASNNSPSQFSEADSKAISYLSFASSASSTNSWLTSLDSDNASKIALVIDSNKVKSANHQLSFSSEAELSSPTLTMANSAANSISASISSSSNYLSSAKPSDNNITSANESVFISASNANIAKERKIKHEKAIKQSRINQKTAAYDRQFKRYQRQIKASKQQIESSNESLANDHNVFRWFKSKVGSAIHKVVDKAVSTFKEAVNRISTKHRERSFKHNMNNESVFKNNLKSAASSSSSLDSSTNKSASESNSYDESSASNPEYMPNKSNSGKSVSSSGWEFD